MMSRFISCGPPGPLSVGIPQARVLERAGCHGGLQGISRTQRPRESHVSCLGRRALYHQTRREAVSVMWSLLSPVRLCDHVDSARQLLRPLDSPGKRTEWAAFPSPGGLPDPGTKPAPLTSARPGGFFTTGATREAVSWWLTNSHLTLWFS